MKPGIYVEAKRLPTGHWHAYLVYRDGKGNARVIRGHPEGSEEKGGNAAFLGSFFGGNLELEVDKPLQDSRDAYKPGETPEIRRSRRLDIGDRDPAAVWGVMVGHGRKLKKTDMEYDTNSREAVWISSTDPSQNSNSIVRSVQKAADVPLIKGLPKGLKVKDLPGIKRDLSNPRGEARRRREQAQTQREFDEQMRSFRAWQEKRRSDLNPKRAPTEDRLPGSGASSVPSGERSHGDVRETPGRPGDTAGNNGSPEQRAVLQKMAQLPQTPQEILSKPFRKVTEDEIGQLIGADGYWERGMPLHSKLQNYVRGWMDDAYGTGPLQYDDAGQMIRPQPVYALATAPVAARGRDRVPVDRGLERIGARIAGRNQSDGTPFKNTIADLQTALNEMPDEGFRLKVDGDFGPVTNARLRRAVLNAGADSVIDAFENGRTGLRRRRAA